MKIKIQEPYWSAFSKFGWANKIWGVGFKKKDIVKAIANKEKLYVKIWTFKDKFVISPVTILNYCRKHRTMYMARHNTLLYVIPNTLLEKEK